MNALNVGEDLVFRMVDVDDLKEQDVNAHIMSPRVFERLVENIRQRGQLESAIYCAQPLGEGPVWIVSGHHRARAARAAKVKAIPCLIDQAAMTRSQVVAKQLAHNALIGSDDPDVLRQLVGMIDNPDDLLATGLPEDVLPGPDAEPFDLFMPRVDFDWQTLSLSVLPHQIENMRDLCERLKDRHDLLLTVEDSERFQAFVKAAADYGRFKDVRSGGTVVSMLTELALQQLAEGQEDEEEAEPGQDRPEPTRPMWTKLSSVLGRDSIPTAAADTLKRVVELMEQRGDIGPKNKWQAIEYVCADWLAANE